MEVTVIRSARRRRSSHARIVDGRIEVRIPAWFDERQEHETVSFLVQRLTRRHDASTIDLERRARALAQRYDLPMPRSIRWVSNQTAQWGSCTIGTGDVRLSDRLAAYPSWVIDGVVVHELAHLVEPSHSARFWSIVNRYPKAERALGFLIAKGLADDAP